MTKQEMTEVFGVMMRAWPNAELFKGGVQILGPTVTLWARCLEDVEYWIAQQATYQLCKTCKFPPSIAEFLDCSQAIAMNYKTKIDNQYWIFSMMWDSKGLEDAYLELSDSSVVKKAIDRMGGIQNWDYAQYERQCWDIYKENYMSKGMAQPRLVQQGGKP